MNLFSGPPLKGGKLKFMAEISQVMFNVVLKARPFIVLDPLGIPPTWHFLRAVEAKNLSGATFIWPLIAILNVQVL